MWERVENRLFGAATSDKNPKNNKLVYVLYEINYYLFFKWYKEI